MEFLFPIEQIFSQLPSFALVLFRIGGLMVAAPILGAVSIPPRIRVMLALVLAFLVFPLVPPLVMGPSNLIMLVVGVAGEMLIGITMGFILSLVFLGIKIGAELISQQMGLSLAQIVDPFTQDNSNVLGEFYSLLATIIYLLIDGHLVLISTVLATFRTIPLMGAIHAISQEVAPTNGAPLVSFFCTTLISAFTLGIRIAGPALIAVFLATLALGFVSRTMPQLNILAAGFPIRITLAFVVLIASIGTAVAIFKNLLADYLVDISVMFIPPPA
ncbi:MAG: flagellar biosynthetic protein FliR [Sedimentisphaerales bacterium]|nr:flagellar biosynthetic protein FliR [Sedimentisphaerales bacterium]